MKLSKQSQHLLDFCCLTKETHENCAGQGSSEERTESESQDSDGVNIWKRQNLNQNKWSFLREKLKIEQKKIKIIKKQILNETDINHKFNVQLELVKILISVKVKIQRWFLAHDYFSYQLTKYRN